VLTASDGTFSISGAYNCTVNTQIYLYALGGNPGAVTNSAAGFLAPLGNCPAAGTFSTSTFVYMNEVTTIATAYALAGFATDATHVSSSGTALSELGLSNAFANINNLVSSTGTALATTPSGNGTVPQTTINTLANILAACVNSTGPLSNGCSILLSYAKSSGSTGTAPTDTATAAINIAHNAGTNVADLFEIPNPTPPFAPALPTNSAPNDFSLGIKFSGGGLNAPGTVAIDGSGNVWIANIGGPALSEFSSTGAALSGPSGYSGGDPFNYFFALAIDTSGNAWVTDPLDNDLVKFSSSGVASANSPIVAAGVNAPYGFAFNTSGNVWVANSQSDSLSVLTSVGVPVAGTPYTGGGLNAPTATAIDGYGNVWVIDGGSAAVSKFSSAGVSKAGTTGYTANFASPEGIAIDASGNAWIADSGTGIVEISPTGSYLLTGLAGGDLDYPNAIAIDGLGNAWVANPGGVVVGVSSAGTFLTGNTGYISGLSLGSFTIAIDGSGNAWLPNNYDNSVTELIGVAAPVVTPLATGVKNNTLGTRP